MLDAAAAATADRPPIERRRRLTAAALAVTNQKVRGAYSPIVIAGAVRLADFVLLSLIGVALYFGYVSRLAGFHWEYVAAIFAMAATAVICFQAADIYEVQVFRGNLRQMARMVSSWAFVFLLFIGVSFFATMESPFTRQAPAWLSLPDWEGCIEGYESLRKAGFLHRDISINNIMMNEDDNNTSWPSSLIDLDLGIRETREEPSGARGKTGAKVYMAIGVLLGDQHCFMHGLDSFFWVLFWICIHCNGPDESRVVPNGIRWILKKSGAKKGKKKKGKRKTIWCKGISSRGQRRILRHITCL